MADRAELRRQLDERATQQAILEARLKAQQEGLPAQLTPEIEHYLQDTEKTYGPEMAALMRSALEAKRSQALQQAERQALESVQEQKASELFVDRVAETAAQRFPTWAEAGQLDNHMVRLLSQYSKRLEERNAEARARGQRPVLPNENEFWAGAARVYAADPAVQAQMRQRQEAQQRVREEQIRQEERARLQAERDQQLADANARHQRRPPALPTAPIAGRTLPDAAEEARQRGLQQPNRRNAIRRSIHERFSNLGG